MKRVLADLVAFSKSYLRSPMGAFFAFILPLLLVVLFGALFSSSGVQKVPLAVQDMDHSNASSTLLNLLNASGVVSVQMVSPSTDLHQYVQDRSLSLALQIPQGFSESVAEHRFVNLTFLGDPTASTYGVASGAVNGAIVQLNYRLNGAVPVVGLRSTTIASSGYSYMDFFLPGVLAMTVMFTTMYSMTSVTAEYRSRSYFQLLATTPLGKGRWLVSKIVFYLLLLLASLAVTVTVSGAMFGTVVSFNAVSLAIVAASAVLFVSLGMLIGVSTKDPQGAIAFANVVGFPMMFLSGTFWQLSTAPPIMQDLATVLPLTYVADGLRNSMVYANWAGAETDLLIVSVVAVVMFVLASRLVSWKAP